MAISGPLRGVKALDLASIDRLHDAADVGADVLRIESNGAPDSTPDRLDARGRCRLTLDLKQQSFISGCLERCESAEIVIKGSRPGAMDDLDFGLT